MLWKYCAFPLSTLTTASMRPSLSTSPNATPRCGAALWKSAPAPTLTSSNFPFPKLRNTVLGSSGSRKDILAILSSACPRTASRSFHPSLSKSAIPFDQPDRKSTRLNSSHSLHDALPIWFFRFAQRHLSDIVERVPAHRQQVLPSVIVEIGNPIRPARHGAGDGAHTGDGGDLREISRRAAILEQRKGVAFEGGHPDVVVAVVVDVPEIGAHARNVSAGLGVRNSRL